MLKGASRSFYGLDDVFFWPLNPPLTRTVTKPQAMLDNKFLSTDSLRSHCIRGASRGRRDGWSVREFGDKGREKRFLSSLPVLSRVAFAEIEDTAGGNNEAACRYGGRKWSCLRRQANPACFEIPVRFVAARSCVHIR